MALVAVYLLNLQIKILMKKIYLPVLLILWFIFQGCQHKTSDDGFTSVFDGKTLNGWRGDTNFWRAEDDILIGETTPENSLTHNTFLILDGQQPDNFELKLEYRISADGNSGINYRSEEVPDIPFALKGYQFDIDGRNVYTGQNYEERGRAIIAHQGQTVVLNPLPDSLRNLSVSDLVENNVWTQSEIVETSNATELKSHIKSNSWNACHLVVEGNTMKHFVNGVLMSEVIDNDPFYRKNKGFIGLQLHMGPPMKVEFRNIQLKSK